jgi:hypothetical protein
MRRAVVEKGNPVGIELNGLSVQQSIFCFRPLISVEMSSAQPTSRISRQFYLRASPSSESSTQRSMPPSGLVTSRKSRRAATFWGSTHSDVRWERQHTMSSWDIASWKKPLSSEIRMRNMYSLVYITTIQAFVAK